VLNIKTVGAAVVGAAAIGLSVGSVQPAQALSFNFSFTNTTGTTPGTVNGILEGLVEGNNPGNAPGLTVSVTSSPGNVGLGLYSFVNGGGFTVTNGNITLADGYWRQGASDLYLGSNPGTIGGTTYYPELVGPGYNVASRNAGATFTPATAIPTPALLPGLLGMGVVTFRKKRKSEQSQPTVEAIEA
jgi:hypothetical protein